jgi:acyl-homoserine-lactone acylase
VRALFEAYAAGLNRYAATHPGEVKLAGLFPANGLDIATGFALRQPFFFGLDGVLGRLVGGEAMRPEHGVRLDGLPDLPLSQGGGDQFKLPRPMPLPMGEDGALAGSNAFAVAPSRSGDGVTRLNSNAHQPWKGGVAWYELEVSSDEGWHFAGATFPGSPYPFLGHNENLGWTNTVNRPDLIDIYRLTLDADRSHYRLDGKWVPLQSRTVTLPVRMGPIVLPVRRKVYRTIHGPAVITDKGAFAIRYAGIDTLGSLEQYYRLTKARDFAEWQKAMSLQAVPSTNFIYADRTGTIAYWYNARIPDRKPGPNWRGIVPGDRSDLIWRHPIAWAGVPHLVNPASGFLFNANNTPFVAAGPGSELDPGKVPAIWGVETDMTNRAHRAVKLLSQTTPIDRDALLKIKFDTGYDRTGYVAWMLDAVARLDLRGEPRLAEAQRLLDGWDMQMDGIGRADALADMVLQDAMSASYGLKPMPDPKATLAKAAGHLRKYFGRLDVPLGDVLRLRRGNVDLPLDGGGDTLRASTSYDIDPRDGRLAVKHGDSFVMVMEWGPDGRVRSESIEPFGAATTRPDSPHYNDQATLFARHQFKPVHFERADVLAHAVRRYVVSNR